MRGVSHSIEEKRVLGHVALLTRQGRLGMKGDLKSQKYQVFLKVVDEKGKM